MSFNPLLNDLLKKYNSEDFKKRSDFIKQEFNKERELGEEQIKKIQDWINYLVSIIPGIESKLEKFTKSELIYANNQTDEYGNGSEIAQKDFSESLFPEIEELHNPTIIYNLSTKALLALLLAERGITFYETWTKELSPYSDRISDSIRVYDNRIRYTDGRYNPLYSEEDELLYKEVIRPYVIGLNPKFTKKLKIKKRLQPKTLLDYYKSYNSSMARPGSMGEEFADVIQANKIHEEMGLVQGQKFELSDEQKAQFMKNAQLRRTLER